MAPPNSHQSSLANMVPITYEFLRELYVKHPTPTPAPELETLRRQVVNLRTNLLKDSTSSFSSTDESAVQNILDENIPRGLDEGMYSIRCACEETAQRLLLIPSLSKYSINFSTLSARFDSFQKGQAAQVSQLINDFLPQDFRTTLFQMARQHGERSNAAAVDHLMSSGGTIRDKYKLLWEQQYKRRETLASIGNSTGMFKAVVKYLAGVPEPLLMFARQINSQHGPTEALREKYSSFLTTLLKFAIDINAFILLLSLNTKQSKINSQVEDCLYKSLILFEGQVEELLSNIENALQDSPFFVKQEEIAQFLASKSTT